ncbi:MAG: ferredoxin [Deltaproteobacteria bacterium RIFCSPLOWO2_12_FULL_40_28]|nr:MAG: ferredoxin [Deltaproteobacteria bacterium RIFCSPHIGHO2_02_FULL_40_28]OGQ19860.1 MAG: ferredoxin [Deltaproteobacteria bacterium RIFCSPHIGHO2_12_FULL_40_32]OGQ39619.1 MAG: ferredoxin [Deltaproteobacteria bacterium RIFCSPLOWO2_02_FULL_40_36]OGQ52875.1 MAG: ferredoxin [Deltaproteobacteria bacterium RIFCSPLOWO2_12_FULL_40_28]
MSDPNERVKDNMTGSWYVDSQCIDCDLCRTTAPANYKQNPDEGYSFVYKQPENDEEIKLCQQALEECPVEAIGKDG